MTRPLMPLEILHRALVLLRRRASGERAEIPPPAGLRILLARVEPVLAGSKLADHGVFVVHGYRLNKQRRDCRLRLASSVGPSRCIK
jgi:DNA-binding response OmpR family regulator